MVLFYTITLTILDWVQTSHTQARTNEINVTLIDFSGITSMDPMYTMGISAKYHTARQYDGLFPVPSHAEVQNLILFPNSSSTKI